MKSTPTISLQYSGIQSSLESLQINKSVSEKNKLAYVVIVNGKFWDS